MGWQCLSVKVINHLCKHYSKEEVSFITETQKLAQGLKKRHPETYEFHLLQEGWETIEPSDLELLGGSSSKAWVRHITHQSGERVLVKGTSVIPEETFEVLSESLGNLAGKPIGDTLLYGNPQVTRSEFYFKKETQGWSRASLFFYEKAGRSYPLLVKEEFVNLQVCEDPTPEVPVSRLRDYAELMRLHRPIPILLTVWPALWGLWLGAGGFPGIRLLVIFLLGAFLMRSAGCIVNDLADRHVDKFVKRTANRPLALGKIGVKKALGLAGILAILAFGLVCLTNRLTIELSCAALFLASLYPFTKRWIPVPQVVLGFAFNMGVLMGFSATLGKIPPIAWGWYGSAVLWTFIYDTYYALEDRAEDEKIGVQSSARLLGKRTVFILRLLEIGVIGLWTMLWWPSINLKMGVILALLALSWYRHYQWGREGQYLKIFLDHHWMGFLVLMGIFIGVTS